MKKQRAAERLQAVTKRRADRFWTWAIIGTLVLLIALVVWRRRENTRPAEQLYGVSAVACQNAGGALLLNLLAAPGLAANGGVVLARSGHNQIFVTRIGEGNYRAYDIVSGTGRPLRYDTTAGLFVDRREATVTFAPSSGLPAVSGVDDALKTHPCRVVGDQLEITLEAVLAQPSLVK